MGERNRGMKLKAQHIVLCVAVLVLLAGTADAWGKKKDGSTEEGPPLPPPPKGAAAILMDPIGFIGRIIFKKIGGVNRILRFLTGKQISEYAMILVLRITCNLLYVGTILIGFMILPKNVMLIIGVLTSLIGPLIALLLIGIGLGLIGFFVYAPCISMNIVCFFIFCGGPIGQRVLQGMGLDADDDGDVDMVDILRFFAHKMPKFVGGGKVKYKKDSKTGRDELNAKGHKQPTDATKGCWMDKMCDVINDSTKDKHGELLEKLVELQKIVDNLKCRQAEKEAATGTAAPGETSKNK